LAALGLLLLPSGFQLNCLNKAFDLIEVAHFGLRKIVQKEIDRSDATVPGDDKIGSRISWWFAGGCQIPIEPVRHHLIPREGRGLIFEIWMGCFYHTSNTINLVSATKYTAFGVMEYCIFMKDLVDCSATTHGVIFAKYVAQITKQQGRYAVGHRILRFRS